MTDRKVFVAKMKARLDQWNAEIETLEARAKEANVEARKAFDHQLDELRRQRKLAEKTLNDIRDANEAAWDDMRKAVESSLESMSNRFHEAMKRYR